MGSHIFLSHRSSDKPLVEKLAYGLLDAGLSPWLDKWALVPGCPWQDAVERAIQEAMMIVVCIGPTGLGEVQIPEIRASLDLAWRDPSRLVVPFLFPGADVSVIPDFLRERTWIDAQQADEWDAGLRSLVAAVEGRSPGPAPRSQHHPPYRGQAIPILPISGSLASVGEMAAQATNISEVQLEVCEAKAAATEGMPERAEALFKKAIRMGEEPEASYEYGCFLLGQGRIDAGKRVFMSLKADQGRYGSGWRGMASMQLGDLAFKSALKRIRPWIDFLEGLSRIEILLDKAGIEIEVELSTAVSFYETALTDLEKSELFHLQIEGLWVSNRLKWAWELKRWMLTPLERSEVEKNQWAAKGRDLGRLESWTLRTLFW